MHGFTEKDKELLISINSEHFSQAQLRLIKRINSLLANVLSCEDESEYFETSAELMKKSAELIKLSNFATENKKIPYGNQALEFAIDTLSESINSKDLSSFDN
jgi:hypothetical protein